jgi:hypothetical protein
MLFYLMFFEILLLRNFLIFSLYIFLFLVTVFLHLCVTNFVIFFTLCFLFFGDCVFIFTPVCH